MEILVMGGTQFVSSSLAQYLIKKGYSVDIFTRGKREVNYEGYRTHLKGDRKSIESLKLQLTGKKYDYVFDISAYTREDVELLLSVLERTKLKNYIFCSSGAVYLNSESYVSEDAPRGLTETWGKYGLDKKEAEDYLFEIHDKENFPMTIFRPTYIFGEGNNLYRESYFFDRILADKVIPIPAVKQQVQFVHIEDLLKSFESAMHEEKAVGNAYNLTHSDAITWRELCSTAAEIVGKEAKIKEIDYMAKGVHPRKFFPFRDITFLCSNKKLKQDGLHVPEINLKAGLKRSYNYYNENKVSLSDASMTEVDNVLKD